MTRRHLFAALASLPFVGRFVKVPAKPALDWVEWGGATYRFSAGFSGSMVKNDIAGRRIRVNFVKDPATGHWYEANRLTL